MVWQRRSVMILGSAGCLLGAGLRSATAQELALLAGLPPPQLVLDLDASDAAANPPPVVEARLAPKDYPEASIIVGAIAPERRSSFGLEPVVTVAWDDRAAQDALRDSAPSDFAALVTAGELDPPEGRDLAVALQTLLAGMECYRARIDGIWGPGSSGAADRYFETLGQSVPEGVSTASPTIALYRAMLVSGAVACPVPQVAATPAVTPPRVASPPTTTTTSTVLSPPQTQQPAQSERRRGFGGAGVTTR